MSNWKDFFNGHAPEYMKHSFTHHTLAEVDFILDIFQLPPGSKLLDMGCGTGRHAVELARRGYVVTGVDLSAGMLKEARQAAERNGVSIRFIQANAASYREEEAYHGAICLCEGAFSLLGEGEDSIKRDLVILENISASLKTGSFFLLTALNGFSKIRSFSQEDVEEGIFIPEEMLDYSTVHWKTSQGEKRKERVLERGYLPTEIRMMAEQAGLTLQEVWGGTAGNWGRRRLELQEIEIMYLMQKER